MFDSLLQMIPIAVHHWLLALERGVGYIFESCHTLEHTCALLRCQFILVYYFELNICSTMQEYFIQHWGVVGYRTEPPASRARPGKLARDWCECEAGLTFLNRCRRIQLQLRIVNVGITCSYAHNNFLGSTSYSLYIWKLHILCKLLDEMSGKHQLSDLVI